MNDGASSHWIGRIIGGVVVAALSFGLFCFWDTWDLSTLLKSIIACALGILFVIFGGDLWDWVRRIEYFS